MPFVNVEYFLLYNFHCHNGRVEFLRYLPVLPIRHQSHPVIVTVNCGSSYPNLLQLYQ